jgi:hypothetical protein
MRLMTRKRTQKNALAIKVMVEGLCWSALFARLRAIARINRDRA